MESGASTPETTVVLVGEYGIDDLDRLLVDLSPLLHLTAASRITIDLRQLDFLVPTTAAVLAAAVHRVVELELRVRAESRIVLPENGNVRSYLSRIDVLQVAAGLELEESFARHETVGFRECQSFSTEDEATGVARELTHALEERCQLDASARDAIYTCLGELCFNVPHHAATPLGGFAAAQGYPRANRFEAAIVDLGVGIPASLTMNPDYAGIDGDAAAIEAALRLGVTSKPGDAGPTRHSGYGLTVTQHLLRRNGGRLVIRSGHGVVSVGSQQSAGETPADFPGTLVAIEARTDAPLDVAAVYQELLGDLDE